MNNCIKKNTLGLIQVLKYKKKSITIIIRGQREQKNK